MKYYLMTILMALILSVGFTACSTDDPIPTPPDTEQPVPPVNPDEPGGNDNPEEPGSGDNPDEPDNNDDNPDNNPDDNNPMSNNLKISVGSTSFNVTLEDNATAAAFKALLPMTVNMSEMNGNEKYYYLQGSLPTASSNPGTIRTGDLMLYGSSCVVLFYETFSTSYSYTRLGRVDNPSRLASTLGSGDVTVTFELQ